MRGLAGLALLLAAAVAFPQTSRDTDLLHGRPNSNDQFEIRPGVVLTVTYGSDGAASRMDIEPLPRTYSSNELMRDTIPLDTLNSILDEILPDIPETHATPSAAMQDSCGAVEYIIGKNITIARGEYVCNKGHIEVQSAQVTFHRAVRPHAQE